ncbi:hypothetical protein ZWY2020_021849 [Hordeum vulgare]|nr:hypothetical protein ZWY2020_021849 [Hordeum vulgare]
MLATRIPMVEDGALINSGVDETCRSAVSKLAHQQNILKSELATSLKKEEIRACYSFIGHIVWIRMHTFSALFIPLASRFSGRIHGICGSHPEPRASPPHSPCRPSRSSFAPWPSSSSASSSPRPPPPTPSPHPLWPVLSPNGQVAIKAHLLAALQSDPPKPIAKKVCDAISELATLLLPENTWAELLPFLFRAASTPEAPNLQESALLIFARLADYITESLLDHLMTIHNLLASALAHPTSPDVRIAALSAAVNLVQCLPTNSDRDKMQDLLPAMMRVRTDCLNSSQEASAQEALELLVELAGAEPRFLRRQVPEAAHLEDGTRHLAVEFVITLAEARSVHQEWCADSQFVGRLFQVLMQMLLDVQDDPAWHTAETEDEDAGEGNNYGVAQDCLDRLAIAIGGNIAEGCAKVMLKNLEQVVSMILNGIQHPHPRVRSAAINAIGQLSTDLGPDLQVQYHQKVLSALGNAMDDFQNSRVQAIVELLASNSIS